MSRWLVLRLGIRDWHILAAVLFDGVERSHGSLDWDRKYLLRDESEEEFWDFRL